jgi:UDP-N-acetylglucosamine 2-epimerase
MEMLMKILNIVGAHPNFMKMAPIIEAMNAYPERINHFLVHTGQHYDEKMSSSCNQLQGGIVSHCNLLKVTPRLCRGTPRV